jgi:DNA gyrase subunit A
MGDMSQINPQDVGQVFSDAFTIYGCSTLKSRAIPNVEDGLSPVNLRLLFTFYRERNQGFKKGAYFVGNTVATLHPHSDLALYDAIVGCGQWWKNEFPLVSTQGNVGSVAGKRPAAQRYLELKLSNFAEDVLFRDIAHGAVPEEWNFDKTLRVPKVLPAIFPSILNTGLMGIGSGFVSDIPIHSVADICRTVIATLDNPEATSEELAKVLKGPDFPTGGVVVNASELPGIYANGQGVIRIRAVIEEQKYEGKDCLVVTEIPPRLTTGGIVEQIADHCKEREAVVGGKKTRVPGILQDKVADVVDLTKEKKIKIVVVPKRDVSLPVLRNMLFENTNLEYAHKYIMNVLDDGRFFPQVPLDVVFKKWLEFRRKTVRRVFVGKIQKSLERAIILRALIKAAPILDKIIELGRKSNDRSSFKYGLMEKYEFAEREADYIVDQQLYKITASEVTKYKAELKEREAEVAEYQEALTDSGVIDAYIRAEQEELIQKYGKGGRKTKLANVGKSTIKDFVEQKDMVVAVSGEGYVFAKPVEELRDGNRGNKGQLFVDAKKGRSIEKSVTLNSHDELFVFSTDGKLFKAQAFELESNGSHISEVIPGMEGREVASFLAISPDAEGDLILTTSSSFTKRVPISDFRTRNMPADGLIAATMLVEGETLVDVVHSQNPDEDIIVISTSRGYASKILVSKLAVQKRPSMGRKMIRIKGETERVVSMTISKVANEEHEFLLFITENGKGKLVQISELLYKKTETGQGASFLAIKLNPEDVLRKNVLVGEDQKVVITAKSGKTIKIEAAQVNTYSRNAKGNRLVTLNDGDKVASVTVV